MPCSPKDVAVAVKTRSIMAADSSESAAPSGRISLIQSCIYKATPSTGRRTVNHAPRRRPPGAGAGQHLFKIFEPDIRHHEAIIPQ